MKPSFCDVIEHRVIIISKFSKLKNLFEQLLACFLLPINVADCFCEWRPKKWFWSPLSSNTKVVNWCSNSRISPMEKQLQTNLFCVRQHKQLEFFFFMRLVSLPTRLIISSCKVLKKRLWQIKTYRKTDLKIPKMKKP